MQFTRTKLNQVILVVIVTQFLILSAFGFLPPIFALFMTSQIKGTSVATVGFAITIYWVVKSVLQLFVARAIDREKGEVDDYWFLIAGTVVGSIAVMFYYGATLPWHVYALQALIGVGDGLATPPFYAIFTRHVDRGREAFEWSLFSTVSFGGASAIGGTAGGVLAALVGFRPVFLIVGMLALVGAVLQIFMRPYLRTKNGHHAVPVKSEIRK